MVVTPESFSELPEYSATASPSSRRMSLQSSSSLAAFSGRASSLSRSATLPDPNTVVLDRFEDVSPSVGSPFAGLPPERRPSLPESLYYLHITTSPTAVPSSVATAPAPAPPTSQYPSAAGNPLLSRFRQYIVQRLCQPHVDGTPPDIILPGSTRDMFELEAQRFLPVSETRLPPPAGRKTDGHHSSTTLSAQSAR